MNTNMLYYMTASTRSDRLIATMLLGRAVVCVAWDVADVDVHHDFKVGFLCISSFSPFHNLLLSSSQIITKTSRKGGRRLVQSKAPTIATPDKHYYALPNFSGWLHIWLKR